MRICSPLLSDFPRRFAAASLKQNRTKGPDQLAIFSAAIRRGLIEASATGFGARCSIRFSAAIRRGLIEARAQGFHARPVFGFSAAIRRGLIEAGESPMIPTERRAFSAAIRRGLIEADQDEHILMLDKDFPRRFAAASLKRRDKHEDRKRGMG